jgi:hypothetical protein
MVDVLVLSESLICIDFLIPAPFTSSCFKQIIGIVSNLDLLHQLSFFMEYDLTSCGVSILKS